MTNIEALATRPQNVSKEHWDAERLAVVASVILDGGNASSTVEWLFLPFEGRPFKAKITITDALIGQAMARYSDAIEILNDGSNVVGRCGYDGYTNLYQKISCVRAWQEIADQRRKAGWAPDQITQLYTCPDHG